MKIFNRILRLINRITINKKKKRLEIMKYIISFLFFSIVFFANIKGNSVNYICKTNVDTLKAGLIVKKAAEMSCSMWLL